MALCPLWSHVLSNSVKDNKGSSRYPTCTAPVSHPTLKRSSQLLHPQLQLYFVAGKCEKKLNMHLVQALDEPNVTLMAV